MKSCSEIRNSAWRWLVDEWQWPSAAVFAGFLLLALAPTWWYVTNISMLTIYLQLPLYMLHQWEEHSGDRFRNFVNELIGDGKEVLSRRATFVINSVGVWGVDIAALTLAVFVHPSLGLSAIYLTLVNAFVHLAQGIKLRRYNPGLCTGISFFIPAGLLGAFSFQDADVGAHLLGLAVGVLVHILIIVHVKRRLNALADKPRITKPEATS